MTTTSDLAARFAENNPGAKHNPYIVSTWGAECGRGFATYKDSGGTHITKGGRKARGMASDAKQFQEAK